MATTHRHHVAAGTYHASLSQPLLLQDLISKEVFDSDPDSTRTGKQGEQA